MNARILWCLLCSPMLALPADAAYGPPVIETDGEFFVYGDFAGDGSRGYLVIDRASGGMRQADTLASGGLIMRATRVTGVTGITDVAVGRFTLTDHDTIAVTSPEANRVRVCGPSGAPFDGWPSGVGPRHVTGVDLPGGSAGRSDLVATTEINRIGLLGPYQQSFMLNQTLRFSNLLVRYPDEKPQGPLAVRLDDHQPALYADLRRNGEFLDFIIHNTADAAVPVVTQCSGITPGSRVVYGSFNPSYPRSVFVFHVPGSDKIQVSTTSHLGQLVAPSTERLSEAADMVQPVEGGGALWLAAINSGRDTLNLYAFDSSNTPTLRQVVTPPARHRWSGILPAEGGGWFGASSRDGGAPSTSLRRFTGDGSKLPFRPAGDFELAPLFPDELGSDVLLFAGKPFLDPNPILRGRYRAGGWTSSLNDEPSFPAGMDGYFEVWRGAPLGLGNPVYRYLGIRPPDVTHGLSNQIAPDASFYSLDAPIGGIPDLIQFDPEGGPQSTGIEVVLSADDPATTIYYATNASTRWLEYTTPIRPLSSDTTLRAFALIGDTKSPIQTATYTFPAYPGDVDSDGDGLPDFVEAAHGLDPLDSGLDDDGDGVPDLQEILSGTDPTDAEDVPDPASIRAYTRHFDIHVEPMSHSGVPPEDPLVLLPSIHSKGLIPSLGTWVTATRPNGTLELEGAARKNPLGPQVQLEKPGHIAADPPLFWVAGTPNRFNIEILEGRDQLRGRGVFRLLDYEAPDLYPLPRPELSGHTSEQAAQWVTAMRDHFRANAGVDVGGTVSLFETVDLLLAEHALAQIFHSRGWIRDPRLSLTPFRGDATIASRRSPLAEEWLTDLPSAAYGDNGYDWAALLKFIRADILPDDTSRKPLDDLAREIYRIGYHAYDDVNKPFNVAPFDALRDFMEGGALPAAYEKQLGTPREVLERALTYLKAFEHWLPQRNHTTSPLTLTAMPGFFHDPWIVLEQDGDGADYWLADKQGSPLKEPAGFRILPGCRFLVTGHQTPHPGGGDLLMVDSISLIGVPTPDIVDTDANTLPDAWEAFYYGTLGNDAFGDSDHDGFQALQEMFEITDPRYSASYPAVPMLDLRLPKLDFVYLGEMQFDLSWHWPTTYQHRVHFYAQGSSDLQDYVTLSDNIPPSEGDLFEVFVDGQGTTIHFFRVGFGLR